MKKILHVVTFFALLISLYACTQEVPPNFPSSLITAPPSLSPVATSSPELEPSLEPPSEPFPEPLPEPGEEDFLLPVYANTMAGGFTDLYVVAEDGTLLMWGEPEYTDGFYGGELGGEPIILMENIAAIYCTPTGVVVAVDTAGTLWGLSGIEWFDAITPNVVNRTSPYEPVWIMDHVAMVDITALSAIILKRDGTVWELASLGSDSAFYQIMDHAVYVESYLYGGRAVTEDSALWQWDCYGPQPYKPMIIKEGVEWVAHRYGLDNDGALTVQGVTIPNVVQATSYWAIQKDGTLWHKGNEYENIIPWVVMSEVKQIAVSEYGMLVYKEDRTYWYTPFPGGNFGGYEAELPEFTRVYQGFPLPVSPHTQQMQGKRILLAKP